VKVLAYDIARELSTHKQSSLSSDIGITNIEVVVSSSITESQRVESSHKTKLKSKDST
jgi:hypothetical protein